MMWWLAAMLVLLAVGVYLTPWILTFSKEIKELKSRLWRKPKPLTPFDSVCMLLEDPNERWFHTRVSATTVHRLEHSPAGRVGVLQVELGVYNPDAYFDGRLVVASSSLSASERVRFYTAILAADAQAITHFGFPRTRNSAHPLSDAMDLPAPTDKLEEPVATLKKFLDEDPFND
jgi:hypothetical protein